MPEPKGVPTLKIRGRTIVTSTAFLLTLNILALISTLGEIAVLRFEGRGRHLVVPVPLEGTTARLTALLEEPEFLEALRLALAEDDPSTEAAPRSRWDSAELTIEAYHYLYTEEGSLGLVVPNITIDHFDFRSRKFVRTQSPEARALAIEMDERFGAIVHRVVAQIAADQRAIWEEEDREAERRFAERNRSYRRIASARLAVETQSEGALSFLPGPGVCAGGFGPPQPPTLEELAALDTKARTFESIAALAPLARGDNPLHVTLRLSGNTYGREIEHLIRERDVASEASFRDWLSQRPRLIEERERLVAFLTELAERDGVRIDLPGQALDPRFVFPDELRERLSECSELLSGSPVTHGALRDRRVTPTDPPYFSLELRAGEARLAGVTLSGPSPLTEVNDLLESIDLPGSIQTQTCAPFEFRDFSRRTQIRLLDRRGESPARLSFEAGLESLGTQAPCLVARGVRTIVIAPDEARTYLATGRIGRIALEPTETIGARAIAEIDAAARTDPSSKVTGLEETPRLAGGGKR